MVKTKQASKHTNKQTTNKQTNKQTWTAIAFELTVAQWISKTMDSQPRVVPGPNLLAAAVVSLDKAVDHHGLASPSEMT